MTDRDEGLQAALAQAAASDAPTTIALMRVLIEAADEPHARGALAYAIAAHEARSERGAADRLRAVEALWRGHPDAWRLVRSTVAGIVHERGDATPTETLRYWAAAFDRLVDVSPEASVALYSLGDPGLLAAASDEIVMRLDEWGLIDDTRDALDLGCGIGRLIGALAPRLRTITGVDVSPRMIEEARRRHGRLGNVRLILGSGRDLGAVATSSLDLILAADVFPYLVRMGGSTVRTYVADMVRVLRPGGCMVILNYSYRGDLDLDRSDLAAEANAAGLCLERNGTREFRLWDGVTFVLRKPGVPD